MCVSWYIMICVVMCVHTLEHSIQIQCYSSHNWLWSSNHSKIDAQPWWWWLSISIYRISHTHGSMYRYRCEMKQIRLSVFSPFLGSIDNWPVDYDHKLIIESRIDSQCSAQCTHRPFDFTDCVFSLIKSQSMVNQWRFKPPNHNQNWFYFRL